MLSNLFNLLQSVSGFHQNEVEHDLAEISRLVQERYTSPLNVETRVWDGKLQLVISVGSWPGVIVEPIPGGGYNVSCWGDGPLMNAGDWPTVRDVVVACVVALRVA